MKKFFWVYQNAELFISKTKVNNLIYLPLLLTNNSFKIQSITSHKNQLIKQIFSAIIEKLVTFSKLVVFFVLAAVLPWYMYMLKSVHLHEYELYVAVIKFSYATAINLRKLPWFRFKQIVLNNVSFDFYLAN